MKTKPDPKEVALRHLAHVHGNRKVAQAKVVDFDLLFDSVKRTSPTFTPDALRHNIALKPSAFRKIVGSLYKAEDFPFNLHGLYADAYSSAQLPNCAPWRDYLYTMQDAITLFKRVTGRSSSLFRTAVAEGEVAHYRFGKCIRRFRREDLEAYFRTV